MTVACKRGVASSSRQLKRAGATALLCATLVLGTAGAHAATGPGDLGILDVPGTTFLGNTVIDAFSDSFTFEVASSASFGAQLLSINFYDIYEIDSFRTSLWEGAKLLAEMVDPISNGGSLLSYSYVGFDYSLLETQTAYELRVEGVGSGSYGGFYKGNITLSSAVSPVPEPEIYAMMAIGLGVMGWAARKHKRK